MKKMKQWFEKYKNIIAVSLFFIVIVALSTLNFLNKKPNNTVNIEYKDSFNLSEVPSGLIIWKHGVPETRKEFMFVDSALRYEFFDIGILGVEVEKIYCVRVPYYTISIFQLGSTINIKKKYPNPRNPIPNLYVQPFNKEKKLNNLSIL